MVVLAFGLRRLSVPAVNLDQVVGQPLPSHCELASAKYRVTSPSERVRSPASTRFTGLMMHAKQLQSLAIPLTFYFPSHVL